MFFDTKNGNIENVSLFKNFKFLIIHSGSTRTLSKSLYNLRCQECQDASKKLNIQNLSEANRDMVDSLEGIYFKRASHVISENKRVENCLNALKNNDPETFGEKMYEAILVYQKIMKFHLNCWIISLKNPSHLMYLEDV